MKKTLRIFVLALMLISFFAINNSYADNPYANDNPKSIKLVTKIFTSKKYKEIEAAVNKWLLRERVEVVDIQFSTSPLRAVGVQYSVLIVYKEQKY